MKWVLGELNLCSLVSGHFAIGTSGELEASPFIYPLMWLVHLTSLTLPLCFFFLCQGREEWMKGGRSQTQDSSLPNHKSYRCKPHRLRDRIAAIPQVYKGLYCDAIMSYHMSPWIGADWNGVLQFFVLLGLMYSAYACIGILERVVRCIIVLMNDQQTIQSIYSIYNLPQLIVKNFPSWRRGGTHFSFWAHHSVLSYSLITDRHPYLTSHIPLYTFIYLVLVCFVPLLYLTFPLLPPYVLPFDMSGSCLGFPHYLICVVYSVFTKCTWWAHTCILL